MKLTASRLTTVLGILLGLAYLLVLSGRIAEDDAPTVANTSGGGLSAFAELLRQSGYRVRIEDDLRPRFGPGEFVIVPLPEPSPLHGANVDEDGEEIALTKQLPVAPGGALLLGRSPLLRQAQTLTYENRVTRERFSLRAGTGEARIPGLASLTSRVLLFREGTNARGIGAASIDGRRIVTVDRGEIATNRYIDGPQNAALLVGLVRASTPAKEIVFYEGFASQGGLLSALGDWAFAARNQVLLALGLLVMTLGSRYGLAPKSRRRETGQREQSDALGNLLRRWRGPRVGIEAAIEQSRRRLTKARKLPASAPREQWEKYLSPSLIEAVEECEEWTRQNAREREALRAIARLDAATEAEIVGVYRKA